MKIGTLYPVLMRVGVNEYEVAQAQLLEVDGDEAILEIPATRIVMGINESLGDLPEKEPEVERKFDGVVQETGDDMSDARAALEAEGIELDEDDYNEGTPSQGRTLHGEPEEGTVSLRQMKLDGEV
jgi:hypothetical protein